MVLNFFNNKLKLLSCIKTLDFCLKEKILKKLQKKIFPLLKILQEIEKSSGQSFLVGGSVRDLYLKNANEIENTDLDIEVHNLELDCLQKILSKFGQPNLVGKQFGVIILTNLKKTNLDEKHYKSIKQVEWSVPRLDSKGRKPEVKINPFMGIKSALHRRDITINAMALDLNLFIKSFDQENILSFFKVEDPFDGLKDIENKIINPVCSKTFIQDPLRFYRVMQMVARFEFFASKKMNNICKKMDLSNVSKERITKEFEKMILKSSNPSLGLLWIDKIERLDELFPEIYQIKKSIYWSRNLKAFDSSFSKTLDLEKKLSFCFAVLFCGFNSNLISNFFNKLSFSTNIEKATIFISSQLANFNHNSSDLELKLLAFDLEKYLNLDTFLNLVDKLHLLNHQIIILVKQKIKKLGVLFKAEKPLVSGKDLLPFYSPGPEIGVNLKKAYKIQLKFELKDKNEILKKLFPDKNQF